MSWIESLAVIASVGAEWGAGLVVGGLEEMSVVDAASVSLVVFISVCFFRAALALDSEDHGAYTEDEPATGREDTEKRCIR